MQEVENVVTVGLRWKSKMGCCGQNNIVGGGKCTLCRASCKPKDYSPWGKSRVICWRCKDKQLFLIKEREKATARALRLMKGIGE